MKFTNRHPFSLIAFSTIIFFIGWLPAFSQIQKGTDIDGEAANDQSGATVYMPDSNTVAIGALFNDGNGIDAGHVRIFYWNGNSWVQKGSDIDGLASGDYFGSSIGMPNSNTIAIGAYANDNINGIDAGIVSVFTWNGFDWIKKGLDIYGLNAGDFLGTALSMPDTNTIAIGAPGNDASGNLAGQVRIFSWNGLAWIQKGTDINGENSDDYSGAALSMPDANTIAIGAYHNNNNNGPNSGHVRVFVWFGGNWIQKGPDINGENANDESGIAVSMPDSNTVAIGAAWNDGNGMNAGHARIYSWNGNSWIQKGLDIDGVNPFDESGRSLVMADENMIAIGARFNNDNGVKSGHVRIFMWDGIAWIQKGTSINGETANDQSGGSVNMPDTNTVAIGAPGNDDGGFLAGHVRIYSVGNQSTSTNTALENFGIIVKYFPNPSDDYLQIELNKKYSNIQVTVYNTLFEELASLEFINSKHIQFDLPKTPGLYFTRVVIDDNSTVLKIIKQ